MPVNRPRFDDRDEPSRVLRPSRVLVRCPRCGAQAVASVARVTCPACGLAREGAGVLPPQSPHPVPLTGRCSRCGRALSVVGSVRGRAHGLPVHCAECGATTRLSAPGVHRIVTTGDVPTFGGLDLWLQTPCAGHVLWAYDEPHLDFLERYVAAGLREQAPGNASLASRPPRRIKAVKNRDAVGKGLARLRAALGG